MNLPQLPVDKANHVVYGVVIALVAKQLAATALLLGLDLHGWRPQDVGVAAAVLFGVGKEVVDRALNMLAARRGLPAPHGVEPMDALATASGGAAIWIGSL